MHFLLPKNKARVKSKVNIIFIVICTVFCLGIVVGSKSYVLEEKSAQLITSLVEKNTEVKTVVTTSFLKNIKTLIWIFIFSFSTIGIPFILYILYEKSVVIGCGLCSLISIFSSNKFIIILKLLPQFLFYISSIVIISYFGILFSYNLFSRFFLKKMKYNKENINLIVYILVFLAGIFLCYLSALCEGYIKM
jgi:uncharacterized membrane protein SpoIIM required for sporulation